MENWTSLTPLPLLENETTSEPLQELFKTTSTRLLNIILSNFIDLLLTYLPTYLLTELGTIQLRLVYDPLQFLNIKNNLETMVPVSKC